MQNDPIQGPERAGIFSCCVSPAFLTGETLMPSEISDLDGFVPKEGRLA